MSTRTDNPPAAPSPQPRSAQQHVIETGPNVNYETDDSSLTSLSDLEEQKTPERGSEDRDRRRKEARGTNNGGEGAKVVSVASTAAPVKTGKSSSANLSSRRAKHPSEVSRGFFRFSQTSRDLTTADSVSLASFRYDPESGSTPLPDGTSIRGCDQRSDQQ